MRPLRAVARERWLACLWAPAATRPALEAVHMLDIEMAGVVARVSEPMLAEMRLAWWRERAHDLAASRPPPAQPTLQALAAHARPAGVDLAALANGLEDALLLLGEPDLAQAGALRGAALFGALGQALGYAGDTASPGARWAAAEWWRADWGRAAGRIAPARAVPAPAVPAARRRGLPGHMAGLLALAEDDLMRLARGRPLRPAAGAGRQWALARAALGR